MGMKGNPEDRAVRLGEYLVESGATVRAAAKVFGVSKSTVHKDVTERLRRCAPALASEVACVLQHNKEERHLRGGEATKMKHAARRRAADKSQ